MMPYLVIVYALKGAYNCAHREHEIFQEVELNRNSPMKSSPSEVPGKIPTVNNRMDQTPT
jgi:hypothetical protein